MDQETAKARLRAIEEEELYRLRHEKCRYYEPNGAVEDFINAFASKDYFVVFLSAANGVGKSAAVVNMLANMMYDTGNPWFRDGLFHKWPFPKQGRIITDSALVDKNIVNQLKFWFPKNKYTAKKGNKSYDSLWETNTGWDFDIMTYNQEPTEFEGVTLGWAWFDEPMPMSIFKATVARLRKGGVIIITATPISGSAALYDSFVEGKMEQEVVLREGEDPVKIERKVYHVTADVESACKQHGIRGHLEHEDILNMISEYPEDEREARIHGRFQHLIGLVFKKFTPEIHVIPPFNVRDDDFIVYQYLDPHPRNPDAVLWMAVDRKGTKYVVDEMYYAPDDTPDLAFRIKNKDSQYRIGGRWIDPWAFNKDNHMGEKDLNLADQLAAEGLHYLPAPKQRTAADERIKTALNFTQVADHIQKPPELYIFNTCQRLIWELQHYRWDEWDGKMADKRDRKEKPVDKDDHQIENLGRALVQEHFFIEKPNPNYGVTTADDLEVY